MESWMDTYPGLPDKQAWLAWVSLMVLLLHVIIQRHYGILQRSKEN